MINYQINNSKFKMTLVVGKQYSIMIEEKERRTKHNTEHGVIDYVSFGFQIICER